MHGGKEIEAQNSINTTTLSLMKLCNYMQLMQLYGNNATYATMKQCNLCNYMHKYATILQLFRMQLYATILELYCNYFICNYMQLGNYMQLYCKNFVCIVGRFVVVIDVNPSHGFWTTRLMKVFGHEGKCTCRYNTHGWIVYIIFFPVVCGMSRRSSWLMRNEFLKMTK
jgi:hypothetical protein